MPMSDFQSILFVSKVCIVLALAWCLRFAIGNRNPKGVVMIWRIQFVAISLVGVGLLVPPLWSLHYLSTASVPPNDSTAIRLAPGVSLADSEPTFVPSSTKKERLLSSPPAIAKWQDMVPAELPVERESDSLILESVQFPNESRLTTTQQSPDAIELPLAPNDSKSSTEKRANDVGTTKPIQITESVPNQRARTLSDVLFWLWLAGVVVGLCRLISMLTSIRELERNASTICLKSLCLPSWLCATIKPNQTQIKESQMVSSPCLVGVFKPVILLPSAVLKDSKGNSSLYAAIAHELMHMKGFDMVWHILMQVQQIILWPLPLVWWVSRSHLFACERVCDESVSALTQNREGYRGDLAKLALAVLSSNHQALSLSMAKQPEINRRLSLLALRPPVLRVGLRLKTAFLATILLGVLLGVTGSSEFKVDTPDSYTSDAVNEPNDLIVDESTSEIQDQPQFDEEDTAANLTGGTDEPKASFPPPTPPVVALATADKSSQLQSKTASSQSYAVHSELNPVPRKRINTSPVNSGQLIHGRVTDTDGLPIDKATLSVGMFTGDSPGGQAQNQTILLIKLMTDSNGNWQWNQATAPGVLGLRIEKDGFVSKRFEFEAGKTTYDLELVKAISVKGKLVDENGQPVSGVRVFAATTFQYFSSESASGVPNQSPSRSSRKDTDAQGDWQIDNWLDETISLIAIAKDGRFAVLENANAREDQILQFAPIKTVTVKVVDSAQNPVVGASLRALGWWRDHVSKQNALTDENGEVTLRSVASVGVTWLIEKPGYRPTRYVITNGEVPRDSITLLRPLTLTAQIVDDAAGQLIKNSRLQYRLTRPDFCGLAAGEKSPIINGVATKGHVHWDVSDEVQIADGNVGMNCDLEFRSLSLSIMAEGYETLPFVPISYRDEKVVRQFRLKKMGGFSVIDIDGKPVADGYVVFNAQQAITTTDLDRDVPPEGTIRVGKDGHVSVDPKALRTCYQLVMAWSKDGCGLRRLCDLGADKPLQLEPWASVKLLDEDNQLNSKDTTSLLVGSRGSREFKWMPQYDGFMLLASWNQQPRKQMTTIRLNLAPGQKVSFSPLGKLRVRGQIDLSTLGQAFLSEHSIHLEAGTIACNDSATVIHKSELGANGEFSFDHLCAGSYRLRIIATKLIENNNPSTIGDASPLYPAIISGFEFQPQDGEIEKNLGLIPCVLSELDGIVNPILSPIGVAEVNREQDDFKNEKPVGFITLQKNWPVQEITFWSNQGEVLRKISKKLDSMIEKNTFEPLEFTRSQSRFFLSTKGEIAAYDLFGSRVWNAKRKAKWDGSHQFKFAGMLGDDLQVYQRSMTSSVSLYSQETLRLQETAVPVMTVDECKFSERDGLYWSIGRKLVSFDKSGKPVSTANLGNSHSLRTYGGRLSLDEVNGGCWFLYMEHSFNGDAQFLNRVDSNGKLIFSTRLPQPTSPKLFPVAVVGGNCFIGASNRIVRYAADGQIISELPIDAKSLAAAGDTNTLWALTKDGAMKIDISGQAMKVAEKITTISGDQLVVLSTSPVVLPAN